MEAVWVTFLLGGLVSLKPLFIHTRDLMQSNRCNERIGTNRMSCLLIPPTLVVKFGY